MTPAITLAGVARRFGAATALADVSLEVGAGEMFGLIGPDGAGKTTAIRLMCGLLRPDAGSVRVLGRDPVREHRHVTGQVGYLSQRFSLYGDLTIDENIAFFAEVHGMAGYHARRDRLLGMTRLAPFRRRLAGRLSGGMKQKLALACTLVHEPRVLLLDEPTTGVDPVSRREFWKLLSEFLSHGMTILMSTPYLDEVERCGRVALLHEGRVLDADAPSRIRARMPGRVLEVSLGADTGAGVELVRRLPGVADAQVFGDRLHVTLAADAGDAVERFTSELGRTPLARAAVRPVPPSLEDVFIAHLSGKEGRMKRLSIGLVLALTTAAGAGAQDAPPLRLTLDEAQARALQASHRLAAERARGAAAAADVTAAELAGRPSVALEAAYTRTNHVTEFVVPGPAGGLRVLYPDVPNNYATRLGLWWPVYTGGRSEALVRAARAGASATAEEVRIAQADLRVEVARTFWALVSAGAVVTVIARGVDRSLAHLSVARERLASGLVAPNEVASARAQLSRQRMLLIEARNQRDLAGARLARLVGADVERRVEAGATLTEAGAPPLPLARLVDQALDARGERRAIEFRIDAADEQLTAASLSMRPTVAIAGGVDLARPNPRIFPRADRWEESWDASVNVSWPLWNGGRRAADVERAALRADAAREDLAEFDSLVALEIRTHLLTIDSGRAAAAAASDAIAAAREAQRVVTARYEVGVAIQAEVLDAELALLQAELDRTRALAGIRLSEAELERARGR